MYDNIQMVRKCGIDDVRRFCVKYNLFDLGTVRDYDKLLTDVDLTVSWEEFAVIDTVEGILFYSDTDKNDLFDDCTNYRERVARLATLFESECIKTVYTVIDD